MTTWIERRSEGNGDLRVAVKDLIDLAGWRSTAGCRAIAQRAEPATTDAACVAGLRAAMGRGEARIVGKTNLHELAYGVSGINPWFGTPVNPLDSNRVPGGSSSGSAVAVATGEADVSLGSDTGGSIRIPAACCGIAGLKTTWGRVPLRGVRALAPSLDTVGPMARDVAGLVVGMALLEPGFTVGPEVAIGGGLKVGRLVFDADPVIAQAVDSALGAAGFEVSEVSLPDLDQAMSAAAIILDAEAWATNQALVRAHPEGIGADVAERLAQASRIAPGEVNAAWSVARRWRRHLEGLWSSFEVLAGPTLLGFPLPLGRGKEMGSLRALGAAVNLAGAPSLALPVPSRGPLPASVQLVGPPGSEERLLAIGTVLEAAVTTPRGPFP